MTENLLLGKYGVLQAENVEKIRRSWQVKTLLEKYLCKHEKNGGLCVAYCGHVHKPKIAGEFSVIDFCRGDGGGVHVVGNVHCNRVWACPLCSCVIQCRRAEILRECIIDWCSIRKNSCMMVTLTYRGNKKYLLKDLIERFSLARKYFFEQRQVKEYFNRISLCRCYCLEMTVSDRNGWHVHVHILFFLFYRNVDSEDVKKFVYSIWYPCLVRVGLDCDYDHGVDVLSSMDYAEYITKMSGELSLGNVVKIGRTSHFTPFQLILDGSRWALSMFDEYYDSTFGRNALVFSRGMKKFFNVDDSEDVNEYEKQMDVEFSLCNAEYENLTYVQKAFLASNVSKEEKMEYMIENNIRLFDLDDYLLTKNIYDMNNAFAL